jgi:hypothetical protein
VGTADNKLRHEWESGQLFCAPPHECHRFCEF